MAAQNPAKNRLHQAKEQMYRSHILDVGEEVFAELGYEGTQVKMVAAQAKISLSTLYGHFKNKMELYRGVHARRLNELMPRLDTVGREHSNPLAQILAAVEMYIGFHMDNPNYLKMHLREGNAWSQANGLYSPEQLINWQRGLETMAKTFKAGMKSGIFVEDNPMLVARTTNAMHQVVLSQWVEDGMKMQPQNLIPRIHSQFIRAFCVPKKISQLLKQYGPEQA